MLNRMDDAHNSAKVIYTALPITPEMFARFDEGDLPHDEALSRELLKLPHHSPAALKVMEQFLLSLASPETGRNQSPVLHVVK